MEPVMAIRMSYLSFERAGRRRDACRLPVKSDAYGSGLIAVVKLYAEFRAACGADNYLQDISGEVRQPNKRDVWPDPDHREGVILPLAGFGAGRGCQPALPQCLDRVARMPAIREVEDKALKLPVMLGRFREDLQPVVRPVVCLDGHAGGVLKLDHGLANKLSQPDCNISVEGHDHASRSSNSERCPGAMAGRIVSRRCSLRGSGS